MVDKYPFTPSMDATLPAAPLEQSQLHGRPLQHRDGHHCHRDVGPPGEDAGDPELLPVRMDLADVHRVKVPAGARRRLTDV